MLAAGCWLLAAGYCCWLLGCWAVGCCCRRCRRCCCCCCFVESSFSTSMLVQRWILFSYFDGEFLTAAPKLRSFSRYNGRECDIISRAGDGGFLFVVLSREEAAVQRLFGDVGGDSLSTPNPCPEEHSSPFPFLFWNGRK